MSLALRLVDHAALSGAFEPTRFLYGDDAKNATAVSKALGALAPLCSEVVEGDAILWRMQADERGRALRFLANRPADRARRWRKRRPLKGDTFAQVLKDCLTDVTLSVDAFVKVEDRDDSDLRDAINAATFATPIVGEKRAREIGSFQGALYHETVRRANLARLDAVLPGELRGRIDEREQVDAFLKRAPAEGEDSVAVMLLTGSAGMGKSAFLADLQRRLGRQKDSVWTIAFDFDRTTLARGGPTAWSEEVTRQIGQQISDPAIGRQFSALREVFAQQWQPSSMVKVDESIGLLKEAFGIAEGIAPRRIAILLDTIEEITARNTREDFTDKPASTVFAQLLTWLNDFQDHYRRVVGPSVSVNAIASGRTGPPVAEDVSKRWFSETLELDELEAGAAARFLRDRAPELDKATCAAVVDAVGRHPLHIILVKKQLVGLDPKERPAFLEDLKNGDLGSKESKEVMHTLYSRFLRRLRIGTLPDGLTEADIQALAHPGLLLREVSQTTLAEVIAPVVGVDLLDPKIAAAAFDALRQQVWLVDDDPSRNVVRHRPDVRRVMVPMMRSEEGNHVEEVLDRAIRWYDAKESRSSRSEAGYLRALRGDRDWFVDREEVARSTLSLAGEDLNLMSVPVQAILKFHSSSHGLLNADELASLPEHLAVGARLDQAHQSIRQSGARSKMESYESAFDSQETGTRGVLDLSWMQPSKNAYDILDDRRIQEAVEIAFTEARFDDVATIGWTALQNIREWPDMGRPLGTKIPFRDHWLWQLTLASAVIPPSERWDGLEPFRVLRESANEKLKSDLRKLGWGAAICDFEAISCMCGGESELFSDLEVSFVQGAGQFGFRGMRLYSTTSLMRPFVEARERFLVTPLADLFQVSMAYFVTEESLPAGVKVSRQRDVAEFTRIFGQVHDDRMTLDTLVNTVLHHDIQSPTLKGATGVGFEFQLDELESDGLFELFKLLRGQTPELHRTVASALLEANNELLKVVVMNLPFPTPEIEKNAGEILDPLLLAGRGTRSLLENAVLFVRLIDICGLLQRFVSALADETGDERLRRCKQLLDQLQEKWVEQPVKKYREILGRG